MIYSIKKDELDFNVRTIKNDNIIHVGGSKSFPRKD